MKGVKIKGIEIKFHLSTMFIIILVGFYAASLYYDIFSGNVQIWELVLVAILNGTLILFSILIHELMHSLVALKSGLKVSAIELYIFGGVSQIEEEPDTPKTEVTISIVGPLTSLAIGISLLLLFYYAPIDYPPIVFVTLYYIGFTNLLLGIFNSLPAFPMDGGRVLRAILWKKRKNILSATKTIGG